MPIESIKLFRFIYRPFDAKFPIYCAELIIAANSRKEAELIALDNNYKFFDQDCTVTVSEIMEGYRKC